MIIIKHFFFLTMEDQNFFIKDNNNYDTFPIYDFVKNQVFIDDEFNDNISVVSELKTTGSTTVNSAKVWKFFEKKEETIIDENGDEKIKKYIHCNVCQCHLTSTNSTTILARHLKSKHKESYNELQEGLEKLEFWPLEIQKEKHKSLVNWIIFDQQPFTVVENQQFQNFVFSIQPRYKLPSRHFVKDMIVQKFIEAQIQINNYLQLSNSKISLTMDMWTSISELGILAVTVHCINDNWM